MMIGRESEILLSSSVQSAEDMEAVKIKRRKKRRLQ